MSRFPLLSQSRTGASTVPDRASVRAGFPDGGLRLLAFPQTLECEGSVKCGHSFPPLALMTVPHLGSSALLVLLVSPCHCIS